MSLPNRLSPQITWVSPKGAALAQPGQETPDTEVVARLIALSAASAIHDSGDLAVDVLETAEEFYAWVKRRAPPPPI